MQFTDDNRPWARAAFLLGCCACWLLLADYDGIMHDGTLYTFQALARVSPALGQDVYLRFGSQDSYTLYSLLYAPLVGWLGVENAALVMTQLSQAVLVFAIWAAARALAGPRIGLLCLALALALPSGYGAMRVFRYFELFTTPRPLAEACVLFAIAACLFRRGWLTLAALAVGFTLHPVIMLPGAAVVALLWLGHSRPALVGARGLLAIAAAGLVTVIVLALALPSMDDAWFALVLERAPYLFPTRWSLDDWALLAPRAATLFVGARLLADSPLRRLQTVTLCVLATALLASVVLADRMHVTLAIEAQFWRVTWLASLVASLTLGALVLELWRHSRGRAVFLMLAGAWLIDSTTATLVLCALACGAASLPAGSIKEQRWLTLASIGVAVLGAGSAALSVFALSGADYLGEPRVGSVVNALRNVALSPLTGFVFGFGLYRLCRQASARSAKIAVTAVSALALLALLPKLWIDWQGSQIPRATWQEFSAWRDRIPPAAEVYCGDDARTCWFLLERKSYVSATQSVGVVFSRAAAMEMDRRAHELGALANPSELMSWEPHGPPASGGITHACRESSVDYIVETTLLQPAEKPVATLRNLQLFDCAALRR